MSLINHLFFATLTSSVTSTFLLLVWWMLRGFFMLVNPRMVYTTLRWVGFSFLLPIGYISILLSYKGWMRGKDYAWERVFYRTDVIVEITHFVSIGWFILALALFAYRLIDNWIWCRKLRDNIPIEKDIEPEIVEKYEEVCAVLNIQLDKVSLQRNVTVDVPMIIGNKHPQVILPEQDYTAEELEIIFYHELSHYKHKDLRCKLVAVIAVTLHCFSLGCYLYLFLVNLWSEFMADASALEASGHLHDSQNYFNKIMNLVSTSKKSNRERFLFSTLSRNNKALARRIDFMKKYQKVKGAGKTVTAAITAAFMLLSTSSIYASGQVVTDIHNIIYQNTEERTDEGTKEPEKLVLTDDGYVEHYVDVEDLDFEGMREVSTLEQDIVSLTAGVHYNIDWNVVPNTRHVSSDYKVSKGQTMSVSVTVVPNDKEYWLGIMREGHARYIVGKGAAAHNFVIDTTDRYRAFVQNNYKKDVYLDAKGYFEYE